VVVVLTEAPEVPEAAKQEMIVLLVLLVVVIQLTILQDLNQDRLDKHQVQVAVEVVTLLSWAEVQAVAV
jgi:hypothetical protein